MSAIGAASVSVLPAPGWQRGNTPEEIAVGNRPLIVCLALTSGAWVVDFSAQAQTIVNNTTVNNNTTHITIKNQNVIAPRPQPSPSIRTPSPPPAPSSFHHQPRELLPYMSARCAQLYEAQLNGYTRRMSSSVASGVRDEFQSHCPDALAEARQSLYQAKLGPYTETQNQKLAAKASAEQERATKEQCDELLRILASKRKRLESMTDGEKADHTRFENSYTARCKAG